MNVNQGSEQGGFVGECEAICLSRTCYHTILQYNDRGPCPCTHRQQVSIRALMITWIDAQIYILYQRSASKSNHPYPLTSPRPFLRSVVLGTLSPN